MMKTQLLSPIWQNKRNEYTAKSTVFLLNTVLFYLISYTSLISRQAPGPKLFSISVL